jgi:hypothetical protein
MLENMPNIRRLRRSYPSSRQDWMSYYVKRFNRTSNPDCAHLAMWYQLLDLADNDA